MNGGSGGTSTEVLKTIGVAGVCGVGTCMVSVFFSETVRPKALKASTRIVIICSKLRDDGDTMHASSTYSTPNTARRTCCFRADPRPSLLEGDKVGNVGVLTEAF